MLSFKKDKRSGTDLEPLLDVKKRESGYGADGNRRESTARKPQSKSRSLRDLYRYSSACDVILLFFGVFGSVVNGAGLPTMSVLFGNMANSFILTEKALKFVAASNSSNWTSIVPSPAGANSSDILANLTLSEIVELFDEAVVTYSIYYVCMGAFILLVAYIQTSCWIVTCEHQIDAIRKDFFKCILRQDVAWFDKHPSGELTTQLSDNLERIKEGIGDKLGLLIQYVAQFFAGFIIAFIYNWKLTLVLMCFTPIMAVVTSIMGKLISYSAKKEHVKYAMAGTVAEEVLSSIRTVIAFNGQKRENARYEDALQAAKRTGIMKSFIMSLSIGALFLIVMSSYGLGFWYGATLIVSGEVDYGTVFVVIMAVMAGSTSLGNTGPQLAALQGAKGAACAVFDIIDTKPKIDVFSTAGIKLDTSKGRIELRDVHFSYPSRKDVPVLNGITIEIEPGQCLAIVGSSGCGKSTIVNLLLRFYDVDSGEVILDGLNVKSLNLHSLRNLIAVVSQEPILFDATIEENIRFGRVGASKLEVIEAAKVANAHSFITTLPEGYRTRVGERGTQLSGGQKQRIAIARALLRKPKVLLLDEATSALDSESESLVQEALDKARQGHTTIVIAHRLSTIRNADKILALKDGRIVESGTHEELISQRGLYYDLVTAQTLDTPEEAEEEIDDDAESDPDGFKSGGAGALSADDQGNNRPFQSIRKKTESMSSNLDSGGESKPTKKISRTLGKNAQKDADRLMKAAEEEQAETSSLFAIFRMAKSHWWAIALGFIGCMARGIGLPLFSFLYSQVITAYSLPPDEIISETTFYALLFVAIGVTICIGDIIAITAFGLAAENLTMNLRLKVFANILRQDASYFDNPLHSSGKLCVRLSSDAPMIRGALSYRLGSIVASSMSMITATAIGFIYSWKLTLFMLLILPLFVFATFINLKLRERNDNRDAVLLEEAGHTAAESIENVRTVQSLTSEMPVYQKFCYSLDKPYKQAIRYAQVQSITYAFSQCVIFFFYAMSFRFGGYLVTIGDLLPLDVFKVFFVIMFCGTTIGWVTAYFPELFKAKIAAGLVMKLIYEKPKIDSASMGGLRKDFNGSIKFDNIHFAYPTRTSSPVLRAFSLQVPSGKTTALIGQSGCGKSTVINLMERFYDPIDGSIFINKKDLRNFNLQFAREQIALVNQEPTLFDCSISENISYGLDEVGHERIVEAAKKANIHEFVMGLPEGYKTRTGEKGVQLSGGQKQRIAIARALIRNPKVLLLDEATSALDTENEKAVQEALDKARQGRTCIVVAHRLSTVQNADHIAVLRHGRVIEQGTHSELITKRGVYYEMTRKQHL